MKNNILKSIFVTILLLLGASHAAWGAASYSLAGTIPGCNWGDDVTFDENTNTVTITLDGANGSSSNTYEFKVKGIGSWENSWGFDNGEISTSGSLNLVKDKGNVKFHPNGAGDYEFKWDPTTTTITITYPSASGGGSTCTLSAAPAEVIAGTNVMFYVQSYNGDKVTIGTSAKDVSAAKYTNVADGKSYINIAKASLKNNTYITNNPGGWNGVSNDGIASAEGGEYFVGNNTTSTTAAKTATTTTTINGNTLNISTTANSAKGVYNDLQLYIQYYIDATFAGVTYSEEEATYCSIKASTSAVLSTYDISYLSTGEHTLLTVLTDGNIYYIADTDNFSVGSSFTVTFNANGHGTAPEAQKVPSGGKATEPTAPTAAGYTFGGWYTDSQCTNKYDFSTAVTKNITLYAKWTAATITTYTVVGSSGTVFGTKDCETCTANDMVKQADGTYVLKKSVTNLSATTRDYYIVGNHDGKVWRYPASGTLQYENPTAGDYDITFTLDLSTNPVIVSCTMVKAVSSTNFYYYDGKGGWNDANCVKFTKETEYAYATLTGYQQDNEFKIFDGNTKSADNWYKQGKDNEHTVACAPHIDNQLGNIELGKAGEGAFDNAKFSAASISTSTFYVILYYPNTTLNSTSTYKLCASTTLPGGIAPAQDWYVYGAGGELSWDKNSGKKMSLHGDGYYYYTCSGVSQFKIDGSTLTDDALGGTYISNSFPDAATANITLADDGEKYHNITVTNATGKFEIRLYPAGKAGNTTSNHIIIAHRDVIAAGDFWYFDDKNTGWDNTIADKWKFVDAGDYAYVSVPARNSDDNFFKIFPVNPKVDSQVTANGNNIADGDLAGEIQLTAEGGQYNNIKIAATTADYYVILYYPNTSTNSSDKYLVAATYDLPGVQKYAVSFGVVGKTGGTITAKSGSSTITSGQLVSRATFTATPAAGYSVEGWYADAEGNTRITAAGTQTTYSQAITEANNSVYVKFAKTYAIYYKFNDQNWNDDYYAYIFTDEVWHNDKGGVQPQKNRSEYGKMTKYNDSVYYYKFTGSADYPRFAFSWGDKTGQDLFYQVSAVYRKDFDKDMPVFISQRGQAAEVHNEAPYYNKGVWMKFNDTDPGYNLGLRNQTDNNGVVDESYRFTAAKAGDYISTVDVALVAGKTYSFLVKNDKDYYFTPNNATTCTPSNSHFELYKSDNKIEVVIKPTVTGTYTFQLNLANGKVEIDVLYPTTSYRLVYVEKNGSTIEKFHPSHIIKSHPEATTEAPMFDTVSMHVRLYLLQKKQAVSGTTDVKYDTLPNSNTCQVWLQEFKEDGGAMDWKTIQIINTKEHLTTNGVYNFIITQAAGTTTIEPTAIRPYTGRYYIRTVASDGGWKNYKQLSNYCYYTEYSRVYRGFDYYFCRWASKENITYTIACDYSYCVSDTLAQEDHAPHNTYTDADGNLQHEANVRFMWHSFSNELDRAYIAGAGDNLYLMSNAGIYDMKGNQNTSAKLEDQQNWVYRVDVKADTKARIKLRAVPYNGANTYSWFRGLDGDFSDAKTEQLIEGKSGTQYTIRVIYDFKTDHLICAWIPDKDTITSDDVINADLMIIRKDQGEAAQLNFKPNETKLTNITVAYCVLNLTHDHLSSTKKSPKEKSCYWVSFPFDVNLSDVFGCGKYGEDFIIQYYDGAERAEKGCWIDSPTYWKYITNPTGVVLKKGMGYVLVIDYAKIVSEQFKHNNTSVNIYFPSSGPIDAIDGVLPTAVEVPEHKCTITRNDRYIYDSNWNIIGVPTWANIDEFGNPMVAEQITSDLSQGDEATYTIGFYYAHDAKNSKWIVCETNTVNFWSMYSYLVQWAGTINWQEKSVTGEHHPSSLAPRRYAPAAEEEGEATAPEQYTLRLTLHRGETQLDHTYVRLQEGNVTTDFDLNYDMTKILNSGANLYSLVGTNLIQCAANVQPLQEEAKTISIPLGVVADQDGLYTFSLPEGTEGMNVSIADSESGTVHNLALGDYQTALTKGTYEGRFALEIQPRQGVSTGCEQTDAAGKHLRKVLIDGNLYILRDGKAYTAAGQEL